VVHTAKGVEGKSSLLMTSIRIFRGHNFCWNLGKKIYLRRRSAFKSQVSLLTWSYVITDVPQSSWFCATEFYWPQLQSRGDLYRYIQKYVGGDNIVFHMHDRL